MEASAGTRPASQRSRWQPLTPHCRRPPAMPETPDPDPSRTRSFWGWLCPAGWPPAGLGCRGRRATSPACPNLRRTGSVSHEKHLRPVISVALNLQYCPFTASLSTVSSLHLLSLSIIIIIVFNVRVKPRAPKSISPSVSSQCKLFFTPI